jgi:FMN-dependent NADH-azoreductase
MKLLHDDSSIFGEGSISRVLSADVVAAQCALHLGIEVNLPGSGRLSAPPPDQNSFRRS